MKILTFFFTNMESCAPIDSVDGEIVNATRLEDDPWAILALVDLVLFYVDESPRMPS